MHALIRRYRLCCNVGCISGIAAANLSGLKLKLFTAIPNLWRGDTLCFLECFRSYAKFLMIHDLFFFPFLGSFLRNRFGVLRMRNTGCRYSFIRRLFLPNYSSQKEEFGKKCTLSRRIKRDGRPLHLKNPCGKRKEERKKTGRFDCYKRQMRR